MTECGGRRRARHPAFFMAEVLPRACRGRPGVLE
nr:MAG TPA: hypothetical protein [Caudoviricetes sp.]